MGIALFTIQSIIKSTDVEKTSTVQNPFIDLIVKQIESISALPDNKFNKDIYNETIYLIDEYYKPHPPQHPSEVIPQQKQAKHNKQVHFHR